MTVASSTTRTALVGDGATLGPFTSTFKILDDDHVAVYVAGTLKTLTTHYTVSGAGGATFTVTFTSGNAPANGAQVLLIREVPLTQETDYVENDPFPAETHETALDLAAMVSQQLSEELDRAIKMPVTTTLSDIEWPVGTGASNRGSKLVRWTTDGTALELVAADSVDAVGVVTTEGDLVQGGTDGVPERLAISTRGALLRITSALKAGWLALGARGGILTAGADDPQYLAIGTSGKFLKSDGTDPTWDEAPLPRGYLSGFGLANNGSDATNDIDIAAGAARDKDNGANIVGAALTKQLDAVWAVGTNAGMLASGAAITNTTYHIFAILRPDTGVVDYAADTSATGANIAANTNAAYTKIRRIGSIVRTGGAIKAFSQNGDDFLWTAAAQDLADTTSPGTTAALVTLTIPVGLVLDALVTLRAQTSAALNTHFSLTATAVTDAAASLANSQIYLAGSSAAVILSGGWQGYVRADTSAQIRRRCDQSSADVHIAVATNGYRDRRGRDA
jgi:hypothetical protein